MIRFEMALVPFGRRIYGEHTVLFGQFVSCGQEAGKPAHAYSFFGCQADGGSTELARGLLPKTRSGHRNPLHLLAAALADIDLGGVPPEHASTIHDVADRGALAALRRDAIGEAVEEIKDRLRQLAQEGQEGAAAIAQVRGFLAELAPQP